MATYASGRHGLAIRVNPGDRGGADDLNQVIDSLLAGKRVLIDILGGPGLYQGGAATLADLGQGTHYPPVTLVVNDDAGNPWLFQTPADTAITFLSASTAAGDARLYAVPVQMAGVQPAAADARYYQVALVADDVANGAPAHSLLLGTGTITASAFTAYAAEDLTPAEAKLTVAATGDVTGPASSVTGNLASWNGAGGDTLADSGVAAVDVAKLATANTFTANQTISNAAPEAKLTDTTDSLYARWLRDGGVTTHYSQQTKTAAVVPGYALSLDAASTQYASSAADNDMSGNNWSFEAWVYVVSHRSTGLYIGGLFGKNENNKGIYCRFGDGSNLSNNNKLGLGVGSGTGGYGFIATDAVSTGAWHHVAITSDGSYIRFYLDGALDSGGAQSYTAGTAWANDAIVVGADSTSGPSGRTLNGRLDEVAVWNKTLSLAEVQARYNSGVGSRLAGTETSLVYCWHFDENTGSTAANAVSSQPSLTLQNSAGWAAGKVNQSGGATSTVEVGALKVSDAVVAGNEGRVEMPVSATTEMLFNRFGLTRDTKFGPPTGGNYYQGQWSLDRAGALWYYDGSAWVQHSVGLAHTWSGGGADDITTAGNWNGGALLAYYKTFEYAYNDIWTYDTTSSRWLGRIQQISLPDNNGAALSATGYYGMVPLSNDYDWYLVEFSIMWSGAAGTWDASNRWALKCRKGNFSLVTTQDWSNVIYDQAAGAGGDRIGAVSSAEVILATSTYDCAYLYATKTGSPGNLTPYGASILVREVRK